MKRYVCIKQNPMYKQMSLDDLFYGNGEESVINYNYANTKTLETESAFLNSRKQGELNSKLIEFNNKYKELRDADRHSLFRTFYIPKKSGGLRKIDAPEEELMTALRELKDIFENDFSVFYKGHKTQLYHTNAFAYIKHRCTVDAVKRHQNNESKWFAKFDIHDFFGSTTIEFVMKQMGMIFPFCFIDQNQLRIALSLAFLDGVLPQGTPISPLITNIMMIPIDFCLSRDLRDFDKNKFVYTRYADDFIISSKYDFDIKKVEVLVNDTLEMFSTPFKLNKTKTRYGSSSGRNWNLGLMLNKDNEITVGHKNKKMIKTMLCNYIMDNKNGISWDVNDIQIMAGKLSYYKMVEEDCVIAMINCINKKFGVDVMHMIKTDIS